jgi:hypothetical protein
MSAKETKYEAIMILQYVKADRVDEFLRDHDETQDSGGTVGTIFRRIGRLVIADLLIDNPDRFTLYGLDSQDRKVSSVWEHDSTNTGNVLVATSGKDQIVALDHDLSKLDAEAYVSTTDLSDVPIGTSGSLFRLRLQDQRNRAIARFERIKLHESKPSALSTLGISLHFRRHNHRPERAKRIVQHLLVDFRI